MRVCHSLGMYCAQHVCVLSNPFGGGCILGYCARYDEVGCCFNSPLSRIIQEQVRPQLGVSWGSPAAPNCQGITTTQLQAVDWSKVDLSEWENMLKTTGNWPVNGSKSMNGMTGAGSTYDFSSVGGAAPQNAQQKAADRIQNGKATTLRQSIRQGLWK